MPLTREMYVQRYNVAASRARDQMWVFHSVPLSALGNPEDMRFQLLDHCYGVLAAPDDDGTLTAPVPADVRVEPFDSLFEQRVANRLVTLGYGVIPALPAERLRLAPAPDPRVRVLRGRATRDGRTAEPPPRTGHRAARP